MQRMHINVSNANIFHCHNIYKSNKLKCIYDIHTINISINDYTIARSIGKQDKKYQIELLPVWRNTISIDEMILKKINKTDMRHCTFWQYM